MKRFVKNTLLLVVAIISSISFVSAQNQTIVKYLSGTGKDHTVDWDFFCSEGRQSKEWTTIAVPSCWEQQGFGSYNYGHDARSGKEIFDEYGLYKHRFDVPEGWKNKVVKIVFEGVMTDAEVKINGKLAGEIHQGAFYEFKYTIDKLLKYGQENLLEVKVNKVSGNESINFAERNADFWIFGGIYRPVYLQISPKDNIERVAIDAKADGQITADVFVDSKKADNVALDLFDLQGNKVQELKVNKLDKVQNKWTLSAQAVNIETWNSEFPNLYNLQVSMLDKKGNTLHEINQRIGFRTIEVRESDGIYVNDVAIKFKGVNRHSFHPESGRTTSKELSIEHVSMIKEMNMNAVRMSHYPPDVHFLDVCDSLGLFVIDELCTWHTPYLDTEVGEKLIHEMIVRDVNHPSIVLWANGNETGWNLELDDEFAKWDIQQREVIHPWNVFGKINTMHYPDYYVFAFDSPSKDKIYFPTEFLHGLYDGGHGAGLDDYWQQMWNMPLAAGGFLWNFADEGIVRTDKGGVIDTDGNHAADGIVGPYGEKEASYFTIKEIWSPIYIPVRYIRDDFSGIFNVENRYFYTNLNKCSMEAKWVVFNSPEDDAEFKILSKSNVELPNLQPGAKGVFNVNKPESWRLADALYLTAADIYGGEIFTWTYPVKTPKEINSNKVRAKLAVSDNSFDIRAVTMDDVISVSTSLNDFKFCAKTGLLKEVAQNGKLIPLKDGPVLLGNKTKLDEIKLDIVDNKVEITALFKERKKYYKWDANDEVTLDYFKWTVHPNGLLDLKVDIRNEKIIEKYMGITFSFPEDEVKGMKWLGDGPYRVWRNRMKGTQFNIWENDYNNTITGVSGFEYPEFKGFFSNLNWAKIEGKNDNGFTVYCYSNLIFLRMLTPEQPDDPGKGASIIDFPEGDISFVKNVPAIGTKFMPASSSGPQGSDKNYFGNIDEPIVIELTFEF